MLAHLSKAPSPQKGKKKALYLARHSTGSPKIEFLRAPARQIRLIQLSLTWVCLKTAWFPGLEPTRPAARRARVSERLVSWPRDQGVLSGGEAGLSKDLWDILWSVFYLGDPPKVDQSCGFLGIDSNHSFQPSFFSRTGCFPRILGRFSRKKDAWKEWGRFP